jgi:transposase-like protein
MTKKFTWNEENTAQLIELAGQPGTEVSQVALDSIVAELDGPTKRSVGSKLRNLDYVVEKAGAKPSAWTAEETAELVEFVTSQAGELTYAEIAASFEEGKFTTKQVQGKLLSLELTAEVKPTPKSVTSAKTYSEEEEATFVEMAKAGSSIEDIALELGREVKSIRGKALSLHSKGDIDSIPFTANTSVKDAVDPLAGLEVSEMTVAEIAESTEKTERGVKTMLTRRGVDCVDHKGADKKAKAAAKREAAAE